MSQIRRRTSPSPAYSRATPLGRSTIIGLLTIGVFVQLVALITLPTIDLYVVVPVTILVSTFLFTAEIIPSFRPTGDALSIGLYVASTALAATTGPGLAGLVTLAGTVPLLFLTVQRWSIAHRLLTDISASMVTAFGFWAVEQGSGESDPWPLWLVVPAQVGIALMIVLSIRRVPGAPFQDRLLSSTDIALFVAPITLVAVTFEAVVPDRQVTFISVCLGAVLVCLSLVARLGRPTPTRADRAIEGLVAALDHRHPDTSAHSARVFTLVSRMLEGVPGLAPVEREAILTASLIHDIGKVATPDEALLKPGALTLDEREVMQRHAAIGEEIVRRMDGLEATAPIVRHHHERWDGAGYPDGLIGPGIPFGARLIAVADTYDAMTHDRVYRRALGHNEALAELFAERGRQFDPVVVDIFSRVIATGQGAGDQSSSSRQVAS